MPPTNARFSLTELANLAGVTPRTIRYYMAQGLLPSPGSSGPGAKYDDADLGRLLLIRKLQREPLPLAEIRQRLAGLDDATIATLAEAPADEPDPTDSALDYIRRVLGSASAVRPMRIGAFRAESLAERPAPGAPHPPMPSPVTSAPESAATVAPAPDRSQWDRISLAPDIELHVRRPLPRPLAKQVDRLVSIARDLLEEDPS